MKTHRLDERSSIHVAKYILCQKKSVPLKTDWTGNNPNVTCKKCLKRIKKLEIPEN